MIKVKIYLFISIILILATFSYFNFNNKATDEITNLYINQHPPDYYIAKGKTRALQIDECKCEVNITPYTYDFDKLKRVEDSLKYVNRERVLKYLFEEVTSGATDDEERFIKLSTFIQKSLYHPPQCQPMDEKGKMVTDPLVLLELGEGRCGHQARVFVDFCLANGYKARLVQLASHVAAEVYYDDSYHFFDVNGLENGLVIKIDSKIPCIEEIYTFNPYIIDEYPMMGWAFMPFSRYLINECGQRVEGYISVAGITNSKTISSAYFSKEFLDKRGGIYYYEKTLNLRRFLNLKDRYYGWNRIKTTGVSIEGIDDNYMPSVVFVKGPAEAFTNNLPVKVNVEWTPSVDLDGDFWIYEIVISTESRGWNYDFLVLDNINNTLKNDEQNKLIQYKTDKTNYEIIINKDGTYYVEIYAYDQRKKENDRIFYYPSNEIKIDVKSIE